jgi:Spy/CpxP family protein refolding chaperone
MNSLISSLTRGRAWMLASLLAIASAVSLAAFARPGPGHEGMGGHGFMGSPRMMERMFDEVNATEAQRTQLRQIAKAAADDLKAQREAGRELRQRSMALFTQPTVDANAAEQLRQQMLGQHDQASKRMLQAMLDASRVLTPEQRTKLAEKMKARQEMHQRHMKERQQLEPKQG